MAGCRCWAALLPALAPFLVLSACDGQFGRAQDRGAASQSADGGDPILAADSPVALTPYWPEGDGAAISGRLTLEDGCLYLRQADGRRLLPTFPWPGTAWDPAAARLSIFGRYHFRVGDQIAAGGGFATGEGEDRGDRAALQRMLVVSRPQCDTTRVAILYFGEKDTATIISQRP